MSGPDSAAPGITLAACPADVVELTAFREREADLARLAAERSIALPQPSRIVARSGRVALSVRPGRYLLLTPPASPGASAKHWEDVSGGRCAVVDLSSALVACLLTGPAVVALLARACRLDLAESAFRPGCAAATIMLQVPAILARLTPGILLLTPATTARHVREWLMTASRPFGLARAPDAALSELGGESST